MAKKNATIKEYKMDEKPELIIDMSKMIPGVGQKKVQEIMTSAISIYPVNNDIYVTDGCKTQLLILDGEGKIKNLFELNSRDFPQPEGVSSILLVKCLFQTKV